MSATNRAVATDHKEIAKDTGAIGVRNGEARTANRAKGINMKAINTSIEAIAVGRITSANRSIFAERMIAKALPSRDAGHGAHGTHEAHGSER